jgi:alpha-mannosidase
VPDRRLDVFVVPHTHWDREWYLPFAVYRRRLLALIDSLLVALDKEPALRFHLDGQMALVDDYLELRPDRLQAIRRAAADGRVSLGPWYTLPDEHLVSGESLIRNLELGQKRAAEVGGPMDVGYLPDQFGHTAQMPQLLRRAGIDAAVLWRGVPAAVTSAVFRWEALDGSAVEAVQLARGYGHAKDLVGALGGLGPRLQQEVEADAGANPSGPWLVMLGDDHTPIPVGLPDALATVDGDRRAAVTSLADFIAARPPAASTWCGELHSAHHSFVLKGTLSARFPLKLRHAALERRLERYVEPAWTLSGRPWPEKELAYAWRQLILNSAHDSICGCSIDQVHEQAEARLNRAERAATLLWSRLGPPAGELFNPSPFERDGVAALSTGEPKAPPFVPVPVSDAVPGARLELIADHGDEYTFDPPHGAVPVYTELAAEARPADGLTVKTVVRRRPGEPLFRLRVEVSNRRRDQRLRLLVPAGTSGGCWAGTAFGAVHRPYRPPGSEAGVEYDLRTDPARVWVDAGGVAVMMPGPFEYELVDGAIAVTLLRCVGWLSRGDLRNRPGHAGPGIATPGAQMLGDYSFEVGVLRHDGDWEEAQIARWAEVFAHPLVPAPSAPLRSGPSFEDPALVLSALRRVDGRAQMRVYECGTNPGPGSPANFGIEDRDLDL